MAKPIASADRKVLRYKSSITHRRKSDSAVEAIEQLGELTDSPA